MSEIEGLVAHLVAVAPPGWLLAEAEFTITVAGEEGRVVYTADHQKLVIKPPEVAFAAVRRLRVESTRQRRGPRWELRLRLDPSGYCEVDCDYSQELFVEEPPREVDHADGQMHPRRLLPGWLIMYLGHNDRHSRSPARAAVQARADFAAQVRPTPMKDEFPEFPVMWARWATIAAAFSALRSDRGPRILPSLAWCENSWRSGSTLYVLPGGRAVLSGGVWDAATLESLRKDGAQIANLYAGAPNWVADPVLNPRVGAGLLSFCYWWDDGRWYRGGSPSIEHCTKAMPGVWTVDTAANIVAHVIEKQPSSELRSAATALVSAAQVAAVTRETVVGVFGDDERFDLDGALHQLVLAGLAEVEIGPILAERAISLVHEYIQQHGYDTTGYPPEQLVAERIDHGWMVCVPVPAGEIAIGRAVFYVADDGVLEHATSSIRPATYAVGFVQRYWRRRGVRAEH
ncbi:hypothetical protein ACIHDR_48975 [Nocardia sp. NPDC052278]|uniref:hypothetical protein n=1 Tax=unclassified Nocardia TaxID=2637762 RepID=UPI0036D12403